MTGPVLGVVDLMTPPDWLEVLAGADEEQAREHLRALAEATWPHGPDAVQDAAVEALIAWRTALQARGVVSHAVVSAPHADGTTAQWQFLSVVLDLPVEPDVDLTALVAGMLEAQLGDAYVERFPTDMGLGVGLVTQALLPAPEPPPGVASTGVTELHVGLAAALSSEPGADRGLLVLGVCLDPVHVVEVAALVAMVAGRSRLRPAASEATAPTG